MAYRTDKDLEFLSKVSPEDMKPLVDVLTKGKYTRQCRQKNCFVNMEHTFHSNTASRLWFQRIKQDKRFKK